MIDFLVVVVVAVVSFACGVVYGGTAVVDLVRRAEPLPAVTDTRGTMRGILVVAVAFTLLGTFVVWG